MDAGKYYIVIFQLPLSSVISVYSARIRGTPHSCCIATVGKMDEEEIDLSVIELFRAGVHLDKKRRKRVLDFFKYLSGGESPLEAVELTLRRSQKIREAQLKTIYEIVKMVENPPDNLKNGHPGTKAAINVLFSCNLLNLLLRVLKIRLPEDCMANAEEPWNAIYYHCLIILKNLLGFSHYVQLHLKQIMENETVEDLLEFCDDNIDVFACFPAVATLKNLCLQTREACERIIFSNGLPKLAQLILKDNCQKMVVKAYRKGLKPPQKNILEEHLKPCIDHFKGTKVDVPADLIPLNVVRSWSYKVQMGSAVIILKIADQNDRCRKMVFKDKMTYKAVMKWMKTPAITPNDCRMIEVCSKIVAILCLNEELSWQMVDSCDIITYLEQGMNVPECPTMMGFLEVVLRISTHSGRCRNRLIESEDILRSLARYVFSYHKELQDTTLRILVNLAESGTVAKNLIQFGITPRSVLLIGSFYQHHAVSQAQLLGKILGKNCHKEWKREEAAFGKERLDFFSRLSEENAQVLKVKGNENFKLGLFNEAARLYTEALQCVPPGLEASKAGKDGSRWWVLPAVLYSNRAQCHLNSNDWNSALSDAHEAMARCLEDNEEAKKILVKTAFRRAKAFLELGFHYRALNDIVFCLRNKLHGNNAQIQYWEILMKYREHSGLEPIRRCGNCMGGEGDKLKRCANCEEVYCSRRCQVEAWELGHKNFCNEKI